MFPHLIKVGGCREHFGLFMLISHGMTICNCCWSRSRAGTKLTVFTTTPIAFCSFTICDAVSTKEYVERCAICLFYISTLRTELCTLLLSVRGFDEMPADPADNFFSKFAFLFEGKSLPGSSKSSVFPNIALTQKSRTLRA